MKINISNATFSSIVGILLLATTLFSCKKQEQSHTITYICGNKWAGGMWGNQNNGYWHPSRFSFINNNISSYEIWGKSEGLTSINSGDTLYYIKYNDMITFNLYVNNTDTMWISINNDTINKYKCINEGFLGIKQ